MVRIRMQRFGRSHRPFYRINAIDQRTRRNGRVIESLGWYDPVTEDESKRLELNEERIKYWLSVGAQPSDTVRDILAKRNLIKTEAWEKDRKFARERVEAKKAAQVAQAAEADASKS